VAEAKRAGRKELVITLRSQPDLVEEGPGGLTETLKANSVLLVIADERPPTPVATSTSIYTWHGLQIEKKLNARKPVDAREQCALPRPPGAAPFDAAHTAVAAFGGTTMIDGVRVTITELEAYVPMLVPLQRYLLVGSFCGNGTFVISGEEMPIRGDGVILTMTGQPREPRLTIDEVIQRLRG
jgi:hypothetical protein